MAYSILTFSWCHELGASRFPSTFTILLSTLLSSLGAWTECCRNVRPPLRSGQNVVATNWVHRFVLQIPVNHFQNDLKLYFVGGTTLSLDLVRRVVSSFAFSKTTCRP
jgi:hypothetical protein